MSKRSKERKKLRTNINGSSQADLYRVSEASHYIRKSESWMNHARLNGSGPDFIRIGGTIFYSHSALDAYIAANVVSIAS